MNHTKLWVSLAPGKIVGPSQYITYLGIEINTNTRTIQLSPDTFTYDHVMIMDRDKKDEDYCPSLKPYHLQVIKQVGCFSVV